MPLASSDPTVATVPSSVTVPAGSSIGVFSVTTLPQSADAGVTITAGPAGGNQAASLAVKAPALASLSFSPASLKGGASSRLTATLNGAAPAGGTSVSLAAVAIPNGNAGALSLPASVTVPAGARSVAVVVSSSVVNQPTVFTVTGTAGGGSKQATVTLNP